MKKYYKVRIIGRYRKNVNIWYRDKLNFDFVAELGIKRGKVVFIVSPDKFIYPEDCAVVSEYLDIMSKFGKPE